MFDFRQAPRVSPGTLRQVSLSLATVQRCLCVAEIFVRPQDRGF